MLKKLFSILLCAVLLAGCGTTNIPTETPTPSENVSQPVESAPATQTPSGLQPRSAEEREPARVIPVPFSAQRLSFNSKDIMDNEVDESIFEGFEITMINIWATWCGPCVSEMPEIAKAYSMLPDNANIITICTDAGDSDESMLDAITILSDSSALEIQTLFVDSGLQKFLESNISAIPTTIFVNAKGQIVGDFQVGVPMGDSGEIAEEYIKLINERLEK